MPLNLLHMEDRTAALRKKQAFLCSGSNLAAGNPGSSVSIPSRVQVVFVLAYVPVFSDSIGKMSPVFLRKGQAVQ